mmetsp:Transcript_61940/g.159885  ORF Transcript_61940/g.159885 Transcript_61940/m.159885 type:complete len:108 (-) Transcript_61940:167-490(-)
MPGPTLSVLTWPSLPTSSMAQLALRFFQDSIVCMATTCAKPLLPPLLLQLFDLVLFIGGLAERMSPHARPDLDCAHMAITVDVFDGTAWLQIVQSRCCQRFSCSFLI